MNAPRHGKLVVKKNMRTHTHLHLALTSAHRRKRVASIHALHLPVRVHGRLRDRPTDASGPARRRSSARRRRRHGDASRRQLRPRRRRRGGGARGGCCSKRQVPPGPKLRLVRHIASGSLPVCTRASQCRVRQSCSREAPNLCNRGMLGEARARQHRGRGLYPGQAPTMVGSG